MTIEAVRKNSNRINQDKSAHNDRGFTLIEILLAVAILGLIMIAVSSFQVNIFQFNKYSFNPRNFHFYYYCNSDYCC